jgi:hypothetical protein
MKTTRYRFEQAVQEVKSDTTAWLKDEFKAVLESDKDFTRKADYIGFSILSIDVKVSSLDEEIKELQQLKKNLKSAKEIALTTGAKVLQEYGIEKIEGAGISSITLTKPSTKVKQQLEVLNEDQLIQAGFYKKTLDEDALIKAYEGHGSDSDKVLVRQFSNLDAEIITTEPKLKINKRRTNTKGIAL